MAAASVLETTTSMNTEIDDIDRSTVRNQPPKEWDAETTLHTCMECGYLTRGKVMQIGHYEAAHSGGRYEALLDCVALPADRYFYPYDGKGTVEEIQSRATNGEPAPNTVEEIIT